MATGNGYVGYAGYGDPARVKADRARQLAEMLQQGAMQAQPRNLVSGLAGLGEAFIAKQAMDRADKAEAAYGDAQKQKYAQLAQTLSGTLPGDTPAISSGAKTTFGDAGEVTTTPGEMVTPAQASPQRRIFEALAASGQDPMAAYSVAQSMAPKPVEYSAVEFGTGGLGAFNPLTGKMNTLVEPTVKPADPVKQETIQGKDGRYYSFNPYTTETKPLDVYGRLPEGSNGPAPPSGYRWTQGGGLEPIPGGPADKTPGAGMDPDTIKLEREFAKDWKGIQNNFSDIQNQWGRMKSMAQRGDAAGDLALVVSFTKMLDPGSVAREGEVALTQKAASLADQVQNWLPRLEKGETLLPPATRQALLEAAGEMYGVYDQTFQRLAGDYRNTALQYQFDPDRVMMGYRIPEPVPPKPTLMDSFVQGAGNLAQGFTGMFGGGRQGARPQQTTPRPVEEYTTEELVRMLAEAEGR